MDSRPKFLKVECYGDYEFYLSLLAIQYHITPEQMEGIKWKFNSKCIVHSSILLEIAYKLKNEYTLN